MNTVDQDERNGRSSDEHRVEQLTEHSELLKIDEPQAQRQVWQRPVLKVLPIERARKTFSSTPDGGPYTS
jgi:hypothetical protein